MISIEKKFNNIPKVLLSKQKNAWKDGSVLETLKNLYHSKCAYCETFDPQFEIEHYRPKKQINGIKRDTHKGYYWLAYEWTNLLPSCHDCNKNGVKGNHFPIEGTRKYTFKLTNGAIDLAANQLMSDYLQVEKPLLLNPEIPNFDPFIYFQFNNVGRFLPKPNKATFEYRQAEETIKIVQLNRDKLFVNRKNNIRKIFKGFLKEHYKAFLNEKISKERFEEKITKILDGIFENSKPTKEYSFFWSYLYQNFSFYITKYFKKGNQREIFINVYQKHQHKSN